MIMETTERIDPERGEVQSRLEAMVDKAEAVCQRLQERTAAAAKATDQAIRGHPYQALGVALGVGVLIGLLVMRARRG